MAEMIATYSGPPAAGATPATATTPAAGNGSGNGRGYLNEVSQITTRSASDERPV